MNDHFSPFVAAYRKNCSTHWTFGGMEVTILDKNCFVRAVMTELPKTFIA